MAATPTTAPTTLPPSDGPIGRLRARSGPRWAGGGGGLLLMVGGTAVTQVMALGTGIVTARLLGVEGRGQVALVIAVATLFARLTLGGSLPVAVATLLARGRLSARAAMRPFALRWALLGTIPSLGAAGYLYAVLDGTAPGLRLALAMGVATAAYIVMTTNLLVAGLQGELASVARIVSASLMLQAPFFVALGTAFLLGWTGSSADVVLVYLGSSVIGLALCWRLLRRTSTTVTADGPGLDGREIRRLTRSNYVNAIGTIDGVGLDRNLVGALLGTVSLGLYSAATAVANMSTTVGTAVSTVLLPRLAAAHDEPDEQARLLRRWVPGAALLIVLIVVALQLVLAPVIELAFGAEFAPAIVCARWLVVADGLLGFRRILIAVLQARGQGGSASWIEISLTALLAIGIVVAALQQSLMMVGVATFAVGVLSCLLLGLAILRPLRRLT